MESLKNGDNGSELWIYKDIEVVLDSTAYGQLSPGGDGVKFKLPGEEFRDLKISVNHPEAPIKQIEAEKHYNGSIHDLRTLVAKMVRTTFQREALVDVLGPNDLRDISELMRLIDMGQEHVKV